MRCDLQSSINVPESASKRESCPPIDVVGGVIAWDKELSASQGMIRINRPLSHREEPPTQRIHLTLAADRVRNIDSAEALDEANRGLHEAEDNFETVFRTNPAVLSIIELNRLMCREINDAYERRTGYSRSEVLGKPTIGIGLWGNREDREQVFRKLMRDGSVNGHQGNFYTKAGEPFTALLSAHIIKFEGEVCALVVAEDITLLQRAEEARMDLIQRLVNAQDVERTRVARELHDSIGQSLALFSMELEATRQTLKLAPDGDERLKQFCGKIKNLGHAVGSLSHQLHSSELELLGLVAAVQGICREFNERYNIRVDCLCCDVPDNLDADISLGLFRVIQEALHNVAKHSQATTVAVEIRGALHSVFLSVSDDGIGFCANTAPGTRGLGLTSMRERILLIRGELTIAAKPGAGTRIEANVPHRQQQAGHCHSVTTFSHHI